MVELAGIIVVILAFAAVLGRRQRPLLIERIGDRQNERMDSR